MSKQNEQQIKTRIPKKGLDRDQKRFLRLFSKNTCNVSATCLAANVGRTRFYEWMKKNGVFAEAVLNIRESLIDWVESELYQAIREKNLTAIIFFLKSQGKRRGWSERFDVELERETDKLFQSKEDRKLISETRRKLALLDVLLVTTDPEKQKKLLAEFSERKPVAE